MHIVDSGLAAVLTRLQAQDWSAQSPAFGHLLESWVVQQIICQAGWIDDELRFSHYRDKDQVEVDLVIEQGRSIWGVEIKRSSQVSPGDAKGLHRLRQRAGKNFSGGVLLYSGPHILSLGVDNCFAVPMNRLWI